MGMAVSMLASMAFCAFDRETDNSRRLAPSRVRWYWTWKVRHGHVGRPSVAKETRELIRTLSRNNSIWGAPRIRSELLKLGIQISEASVAKYMVRHRKPPSQTWRTFLKNHAAQLASVDFFTVPTALFQVLFVFIVMRHDRRRIVHFNVTAHPTAEWTAHQILEAFPFDLAPKYPVEGSRSNLWPYVSRASRRHADQESAWGLAVSVAKSVCGACDRFHTARMFGPCDCLGRERTTSRPGFVF